MLSPATRTYIYGITTAAMPLLIGFGALSTGLAQQVCLLAAAVLGITAPSLAVKNVPKAQPAPVAPVQVRTPDGSLPQGAIVTK